MRRLGMALAALALLLVAGCGGSGETNGTSKAEARPAAGPTVFDESQVTEYLHLKNDYYTAPNGRRCEIAAVLTSANQVGQYADAGDAVATNPAGTAGVKIVDAQTATCLRLISTALVKFPTG